MNTVRRPPGLWLCLCLAVIALACPATLPDFNLTQVEVAERVQAVTPLEGTIPAQWRVIWTTDPTTEATLSWSTREMGAGHAVHFDTVSRGADPTAYARHWPADENGAYTLGRQDRIAKVEAAYYHHARLRGLEPATTYYFVLQTEGDVSRELHFQTAPGVDDEFSLFYGGDSRTNEDARIRLNCIMGSLLEQCPEIIGFVHGGDYIVNGENWSEWSAWLSQNELTATRGGRMLPIIPALGNHDLGPCYDEVFASPGGVGKNYFVTLLGETAALVTLNNADRGAGPDPAQTAWLKQQLAELRPAVRWLGLNFHIPVYPAVKSPAAEAMVWPPVFEQYNVDLVMESDGHCIKRTVPIRGGKMDPTGVVYIGEGGLGAPQRDPDLGRWYLRPPGFASKGDHVQLLDFKTDGLRVRVLRSDGTIADDATLKPRE